MKKMSFLDKLKKDNEEPMTQKSKKSHIPFRLNLLFFVIFGLFVALIVRLGYLQIAEGQQFSEKADANSTLKIKSSAPRGQIYDASGNVLVGNKSNLAITYTRGKKVKTEELLAVANKVNDLIDVPADELTERDKKDFWLANPDNLKVAQDRLTDQDKQDEKGNKITDQGTLYVLTVDKVTPEEINFDEHTMKAATIFKRMNAVSELNTAFIKNEGVTQDEIAIIGEHTSEIAGVSTGMDWDRDYPQDMALKSILGKVSSEKAGLPAEEADEYLAKGYERNDRVGTSYLEKQYEDVLQGKKAESEVTLDSNGKIVTQKPLSEGEKGDNLKLTIDLGFQTKIEEVVRSQYQQLLGTGNANYSDGAYVVVMNPKTGAVMAMVALDRDLATNELTSNPLATINKAFEPGSVVKGATISAGYEQGVITGNDVLIDEPLQIYGSEQKSSVFNRIPGNQIQLNAEQALEYSSNAYMMKLVLKMMKTDYQYNMKLPYQTGDRTLFDVLRKTFGEYGMGVSTGIDLPGESTGISNTAFDDPKLAPMPGHLLDLSFGQYDTYTAMQLAQYASTVANGGTRFAPHLVQGIYNNNPDGAIGDLKKEIAPKELNKVDITPAQMNIIQQGFYDVVHGSGAFTTGQYMQGAKLDMAAKTGTAETNVGEHATYNSNVVAYAPYNDPEIAVSVILPHLTSESTRPNQLMAKAIVDAYADYKQQ
ncbi:penicillin-binding protein 2B [Enterococcus haemoperoxidus ATCC BAA-382]|uniref:Penicillin-binding protein 2B n=1 Tax=Enterococcus haemoperoxidus ATCC BAA-382 TaxID=1158608 RepID=R2SXV7_9ENTE|nr:penicillin-binding transpeptidase domain-containing protein [Enterococcus haemoperoxidus]EOI00088.1 penicillin-binding protein 2B [Enterococcus haemoperoxidus ATCC BAA-382]EOT63146.1 penicillin-binding protein 2B [Enterococcus haemoperoxidus ATCC BAA-382]OJG53589.1 penicillin-binding protein 2B [Enterococcus haemoperoxidus]